MQQKNLAFNPCFKNIKEKTIKYESCFIDFAKNYVNKNVFLNEISFLDGVNVDLIGKIKGEKCTQIMISFPILTKE